ncbi:MAG TPA: beta-galactosidase [Actinoplanes sp.]|nr:beta-galactosidase [Actinoplanes sp.]
MHSDLEVAGPHGAIPVRVFEPAGAAGTVLVWAHGGGFRHGALGMPESDHVGAELARRANAIVFSVGYRLAVDGVRYPVPADDVHAVWEWVAARDDLPARKAIGGASAGAALALTSALRTRDFAIEGDKAGMKGGKGEEGREGAGPDLILLAYPFVHFPVPTLGLGRHQEDIEDMVRNYVGRISDLPPEAFPGAARLDGLPPVHILLSEHDDLRPSGELLERQLRDVGVEVESFLARGSTHGHFNRPLEEPEPVDVSLGFFASALRVPQEAPHWLKKPDAEPRIEYGADYNPEQWPRNIWTDDVRAMRAAGVTIVSLGIFSWARLEPAEGRYDFGWLDEIIDLLHTNGILVDLATPTASPPPWLTTKHPEILPVDRDGRTVWPGARQHWRPTSPVFRDHALRLVRRMANRYAGHPALAAWHVSNELGCHNVHDYSDDAARAFRVWLRARYRNLDTLNSAWGTAFWSQNYSDWDQILPPRYANGPVNPTQQLDFKRFSSDALKDHYLAERRILREITPDVPVTTNFMVAGDINDMNYPDWAAEVDFIANDHYVRPGPQSRDELSFSANLTGNLIAGRPWFLMEHSTSAVNWQPVNVPKLPGELDRDALTHVAHGADGVCYFQWRQSRAGAEKYHSAMLPHAGEGSAVFRAVADLGARLRSLSDIAGLSRTPAQVAVVIDYESWWAAELDSHPTDRLRYRHEALDWYTALLDRGIRADVVPIGADLSGYRLVVAPILHVVPVSLQERLRGYVSAGGHLVTTYFSGIVDEHDHAWLGGYPGALRDLLGIRVEEFAPLLDGVTAELTNGTSGTTWSEQVEVTDPAVKVIAEYRGGGAAVTRRAVGEGSASYVSTRLGPRGLGAILGDLLEPACVSSELPQELHGRVELAVRGPVRFLINRTQEVVDLSSVPGAPATLPSRGVVVIR